MFGIKFEQTCMTSYKLDGNTSLSRIYYNLWVLSEEIIINNFSYMCATILKT
jgi:hypothetical protein